VPVCAWRTYLRWVTDHGDLVRQLPDPTARSPGGLDRLADPDLVYVSLDVDPNERAEGLADYARREGFAWHFAVASPELSRSLAARFGDQVLSPPATPLLVVGPNGQVVEQGIGIKRADHRRNALPRACRRLHSGRLRPSDGGGRPARSGNRQAVLGPTLDGGYHLVGLSLESRWRRFIRPGSAGLEQQLESVFPERAMGTASSLEVAVRGLRARGFPVAQLGPWPDVDTEDDPRRPDGLGPC